MPYLLTLCNTFPGLGAGRGRSGTPRPMVSGTCSVTIQVGEGSRNSSALHHKSSNELLSQPSPSSPNPSDAFIFPSIGLLTSAYQDHRARPSSSSWEDKNAEVVRASRNIVKGPRDSFGKVGSIKFGKKGKKLSSDPVVGNDEINSSKENRAEFTVSRAPLPHKPDAPQSTPSSTPVTHHSTPIQTLSIPQSEPGTTHPTPAFESSDKISSKSDVTNQCPPPRPALPHSAPKHQPDPPHTNSSPKTKTSSSPPPKPPPPHSTPPPKPAPPHSTPPPKPAPPHNTPPPKPAPPHNIPPPKPAPPHNTPPPKPAPPHNTPPPKPAPPHNTPPPKPAPHSTSNQPDVSQSTQLKPAGSQPAPPTQPNAPLSPKPHKASKPRAKSQQKADTTQPQQKGSVPYSPPPSTTDGPHSTHHPKPKNRRSKRKGNKDASHPTQAPKSKTPHSPPTTSNLDVQHSVPMPAPRSAPSTPTPKPRTQIPANTVTNDKTKAASHLETPQGHRAESDQPAPQVSMTQKTFSESTDRINTKSNYRTSKVAASEPHLSKNKELVDHGKEVKNFSSSSQSVVQFRKVNTEQGNQEGHKPVPRGVGAASSRNPLHLELVSKFTTSSSSDRRIPCLRKVKTKEPRSVKELFPDYHFGEHQSKTHDDLQYTTKSDQTISNVENLGVTTKPLASPLGLIAEKVAETVPNSKIYDFTSRKTPPTPLVSHTRDRSNSPTMVHHQSLRVPKTGSSTENASSDSFTRGIAARKSLSTLECVVQL
ncbi:hypothetical protein E2C01_011923 [Portunus trituberculatus]|uniref:Uncharacterized protein n=1 Tax=Portunus trituberculatus TaxID=210409 RepID=A0A5B7DCR6_PORTR|nr:hypothetical protein [Portunus trituberculatus]